MIADSATAFLFDAATDILLISSSLLNIFMVSVLRCLDKKDEKKKKGKILAFSFLYSCLLVMILYIMRHGEAQPKSTAKVDDERSLSEIGRINVVNTFESMKSFGKRVDLVLCSPFTRAKQTAEIACQMLTPLKNARPVVEETLEPSRTPYEFYGFLSKFRPILDMAPTANVLVVSHQPFVSSLISDLLGVEDARISMPTSALAGVQVEALPPSRGTGKLILLIPPSERKSM